VREKLRKKRILMRMKKEKKSEKGSHDEIAGRVMLSRERLVPSKGKKVSARKRKRGEQ